MAWTLVAKQSVGAAGVFSATTTPPLDSTGSDLLVASLSFYFGDPILTDFVDSVGNTYVLKTFPHAAGDGAQGLAIFYCIAPMNNAALTATITPDAGSARAGAPSLTLYAFTQGAAPTFQTTVTNNTTGSTIQAGFASGGIGSPNDLVVQAVAFYANNGYSIDSGFATPDEVAYSPGVHEGLASSWLQILASTNPTWTTTGSNVQVASAISFSGTAAGATVKPLAALGVG